jgi:hypothetical protein
MLTALRHKSSTRFYLCVCVCVCVERDQTEFISENKASTEERLSNTVIAKIT